jgi:prevent-host-death family protein
MVFNPILKFGSIGRLCGYKPAVDGLKYMLSVSASEAKARFGELLERVSKGEKIVITRHEELVARMVPERGPQSAQGRRSRGGLAGLLQERILMRTKGKVRLTCAEVRSAIAEAGR